MLRKIEIQNERILKAIQKKEEIINRLNEITEEGEKLTARGKELEEEVNTLLAKQERQNELVKPELKREIEKIGLDEMELLSSCKVELITEGEDKGKLMITIPDLVEEFKESLRKKKQDELLKENNSSDTAPTDGECTSSTGLPAE